MKLNSVLIYDIAGKGFTRLKGAPGHEPVPLVTGESVQARFFVFDRQPAMDLAGAAESGNAAALRSRPANRIRNGRARLLVMRWDVRPRRGNVEWQRRRYAIRPILKSPRTD